MLRDPTEVAPYAAIIGRRAGLAPQLRITDTVTARAMLDRPRGFRERLDAETCGNPSCPCFQHSHRYW